MSGGHRPKGSPLGARGLVVIAAAAVLVGIPAGTLAFARSGEKGTDPAAHATFTPATSESATPTDSPTPTLGELVHTAVGADATDSACSDLTGLLRNARVTSRGHQREAADVQDRRAAAAYVAAHRWARQRPRHEVNLAAALKDLLAPMASAATGRNDPAALASYTNAFVTACGATGARAKTLRTARTADTAVRSLRAAAKHAPWWPIGYAEVATGVAYQAMGHDEYSCDMFACLKIRVITRDGCDTLYIEEKVIDGAGQVVDFSNDMLSGLDPGEIGLMDFEVTADGSDFTMRMSDVSCY